MPQLKKLHEYLNLSQNNTEYNRIFMSYVTLFFSGAFFVLFVPIYTFLLPNIPMAISLGFLATACAGALYYLFNTNDIDTVSFITTAILATFLLLLALMGTAHTSTATIAIIFPGVAFFLLRRRWAALSIFLFFSIFGLLFWWNFTVSVEPVSQVNVVIRAPLKIAWNEVLGYR